MASATQSAKTAAFNDKKLDVMVDVFGRSILAGKNLGFPQARDSVIASELSWAMLNDAISHIPPVRGSKEEMQQILERRRNLVNGFGLPVKTEGVAENNAPGLFKVESGQTDGLPETQAL